MENLEFQRKIEYAKIMLEEYRTLRSEIINKQSILNNITNFSFAIIGVNLAAITNILVKQQDNNGDEFIIMSTAIIIPLICGFAIIQYYLEFIYTARISRYIVAIEDNINTMFREPLLFWERGIREWDNYNPPFPPEILQRLAQLQKFMLIKDKYVKRLLILPLTFCIIAVFSVLISFYYTYPYIKTIKIFNIDFNNITISFYPVISVIICFTVFLLWRKLDKIVDTMHWSTLKGSTNESEESD